MARLVILGLLFLAFVSDAKLSDSVDITWSADHVDRSNDESELLLKLDSSIVHPVLAFNLVNSYSDLVLLYRMRVQIQGAVLVRNNQHGDQTGTVTSFYLQTESTSGIGPNYYEYDFEFLGNVSGEPYIAQTNVYTGGQGGREQRIYLWFDPTADFHTYTLSWSKQHTVFLVDSTPVRVFTNNEAGGLPYPSRNPMAMRSSLWNGEEWATRGGLVKTNWNHAPFVAAFRNFTANACVVAAQGGDESIDKCSKSKASLSSLELEVESAAADATAALIDSKLSWVKKNYMVYDYCTDSSRYPTPPAECRL